MCKDGIPSVTVPFLHIFRQGDSDALTLGMCGILTPSIVEHDERIFLFTLETVLFVLHPVDGTLVLRQLLPPLCIFVIVAHQRFLESFPLMRCRQVVLCRCDTNTQGSLYSLITSTRTTDIGHPVTSFVRQHLIGTAPLVVDECRKSSSLVLIP